MKIYLNTCADGLFLGGDILELYNKFSNKNISLDELHDLPRHDPMIIKSIESAKFNIDDPYDDLDIIDLDIDDPNDYYITTNDGIDEIHINYRKLVGGIASMNMDELSKDPKLMSSSFEKIILTAKKLSNANNEIRKHLGNHN